MICFLALRVLESILFFSMTFVGYKYLAIQEIDSLFKFLLHASISTFAFSLASNFRLKYQKSKEFYAFQLCLLILMSVIFQFFTSYGVLLVFVIFLKSNFIILYRLINRSQIVAISGSIYALLGLLYIAVSTQYNYQFNPIGLIAAIFLSLAVFLADSQVIAEVRSYIASISQFSLARFMPIVSYAPVLGLMFFMTSFDKIFSTFLLSPEGIGEFARIEVLAQVPLMLMLMVIFYFNPKIFSNKRVRSVFLRVLAFDFIYPVLALLFAFLATLMVFWIDLYIDIVGSVKPFYVFCVFFSKVFAFYLSCQIIYWQLHHKEILFSTLLLGLLLLFSLLYALFIFRVDSDVFRYLLYNSLLLYVITSLFRVCMRVRLLSRKL